MRESTLQDYEKRMLRVLVYIQENLDRNLGLDELAAVAHFSSYHFHRVFTGMVGETLQAHIRRIRLERAAQRLLYTHDPVADIAFAAGYGTHEAFTRAFRSMTDQSPSAFRRERAACPNPETPSGIHYADDSPPTAFKSVDTGGSAMDVQIKTVDPIRVAFMRHVGPYEECGAFTIKMTRKFEGKGDYAVGKLEGQYWWDPPPEDPCEPGPLDEMQWRLLIRTPDFIKKRDLRDAAGKLLDKKGLTEAEKVELVSLAEGRCVQMLHVGPYDQIRVSIGQMYEFMAAERLVANGRYHDVNLSDPRRVAPEKLRTILRLPVKKG